MNIFLLDIDPELSAKYHCDKHVVKMIGESIQLLNVAIGTSSGWANHPVAKWVCGSSARCEWLLRLADALLVEYQLRYKKPGKIWADQLTYIKQYVAERWPMADNGLAPFVCAIGQRQVVETESFSEAVALYRNYYRSAKAYFATWAHSEVPTWWLTSEQITQFGIHNGRLFCPIRPNSHSLRLKNMYYEEQHDVPADVEIEPVAKPSRVAKPSVPIDPEVEPLFLEIAERCPEHKLTRKTIRKHLDNGGTHETIVEGHIAYWAEKDAAKLAAAE